MERKAARFVPKGAVRSGLYIKIFYREELFW